MSSITGALRQVQRAAGLPGLLAAARQAFEVMLAEIEAWQDPDSALFTVYVMAAGYAADGRDAIVSAPSTPLLTPAPEPDPLSASPSALLAAKAIVSLCRALADRLDPAAVAATEPGDRDALADAAASARVVADLLGGTGQ